MSLPESFLDQWDTNCLEARPGEPCFFQVGKGAEGSARPAFPCDGKRLLHPSALRRDSRLPSRDFFLSVKNSTEKIWARSLLCEPGAAPPPRPGCGGGGALIPGRGCSAGSGTAPPPRAGERGGGSGRDGTGWDAMRWRAAGGGPAAFQHSWASATICSQGPLVPDIEETLES